MPIPVTILNANELALTIAVNNGAVAVTGPLDFESGLPASMTGIGWSESAPSPGRLGPGRNDVQVQFGAGSPVHIEVNLPANIQPPSVQVYFFVPPQTGLSLVTWFVLYGGVAVANGVANGGADDVLLASGQGGEA